jgi:hypothetical protein
MKITLKKSMIAVSITAALTLPSAQAAGLNDVTNAAVSTGLKIAGPLAFTALGPNLVQAISTLAPVINTGLPLLNSMTANLPVLGGSELSALDPVINSISPVLVDVVNQGNILSDLTVQMVPLAQASTGITAPLLAQGLSMLDQSGLVDVAADLITTGAPIANKLMGALSMGGWVIQRLCFLD